MSQLHTLIVDWRIWAQSVCKDELGWESGFPKWAELIQTVKLEMLNPASWSTNFASIEFAWSISSETEEFVEFSKQNITAVSNLIIDLSQSKDANVRWQCFEVLGGAGAYAIPVLMRGLTDSDSYVRRRALLSLFRFDPTLGRIAAETLQNDPDEYVRNVALEIKMNSTRQP